METDKRFEQILNRYDEVVTRLANPEVYADAKLFVQLTKEQNELAPLVAEIQHRADLKQELEDLSGLLSESLDDHEMKDFLKGERHRATDKLQAVEENLKRLLLPGDPNDERNVYLEIRSGAGGEEAALFAAVLLDMYKAYATKHGYETQMIDCSYTELGGVKEAVFMLSGRGAYSRLKYEVGVHRVQRVPTTESGGRIHTSTCTVAAMPEVDDVDIEIDPKDLQIDTYRASGAGGQHVNKTSSAIRITHLPTGLVVTCQDERSQHKNKARAMSVLRSRLYEAELEKQMVAQAAKRKAQVGTGDRSERIRTYNYHQSRVTDHRIGLTLYKLEDVLAGDLDLLIEPLLEAEQTAKMAAGEAE